MSYGVAEKGKPKATSGASISFTSRRLRDHQKRGAGRGEKAVRSSKKTVSSGRDAPVHL